MINRDPFIIPEIRVAAVVVTVEIITWVIMKPPLLLVMTGQLVAISRQWDLPYRMVNRLKFASLRMINLKARNGTKNVRKIGIKLIRAMMSPIRRVRTGPGITNADLNLEVMVSRQLSMKMVKFNERIARIDSTLVKIANHVAKRTTKLRIWQTRYRISFQSEISLWWRPISALFYLTRSRKISWNVAFAWNVSSIRTRFGAAKTVTIFCIWSVPRSGRKRQWTRTVMQDGVVRTARMKRQKCPNATIASVGARANPSRVMVQQRILATSRAVDHVIVGINVPFYVIQVRARPVSPPRSWFVLVVQLKPSSSVALS